MVKLFLPRLSRKTIRSVLLNILLKHKGSNSLIIGGPTGWEWRPTLDAQHHGSLAGPQNAHRHADLAGVGPDNHHPRDHAATHELGGADQINVTGLPGVLADLQNPADHDHQAAGGGQGGQLDHGLAHTPASLGDDDHPQYVPRNMLTAQGDIFIRGPVDVERLGIGAPGEVLTVVGGVPIWQPGGAPGPHAASHEDSGVDEINVAGLSGLLADLQNPVDHDHQAAGGGRGGQLDHGLANTGLSLLDDDHPQYLKEEASGGLASEVPDHTHQNPGECGQLDHGLAHTPASLGDDDHPQYLKEEASGGLASEVPDHSHQNAGECGELDHGLAHTALSLLDDDHPQYVLRNILIAQGDIFVAGAGAVIQQLAIGAGGQFLSVVGGMPAWVAAPGGTPDPVANPDLIDDFMCATYEAGEIGELGWSALGSGSQSPNPGDDNHPGAYMIMASAGASFSLYQGTSYSANVIRPNDLWTLTFIVRLDLTTVTDVIYFIGVMDNMYNTPGNQDRYGFEFDTSLGDGFWAMVTGSGFASTRSPSTVVPAASTWYKLKVVRTLAGVDYYIDDVGMGSIALTLPDTDMNIGGQVRAIGASSRRLDFDFVRMQMFGLVR